MTSKLYIPTDTGLIIAEKYKEISNKLRLMQYFGVSQLWLKPIYTYHVGTKIYNMQQYFDCTVVLKWDKDNFSMATFLKALLVRSAKI